ncbi:MAG: prenyltransferase [Blastocatellia bacterium]|nr:prenyltransferase [Blastocatellia bacterium]
MPQLPFLIAISRPRFWIYLFGPFLVGAAAAASAVTEFYSIEFVLFAICFSFPANLLVYGINDIFDYETDRLNPKKAGYELLVTPDRRKVLFAAIALVNVPFLIAAFYFSALAGAVMLSFWFLSIFYSAPPIRAKAIPILDSTFNFLYIMPGVFAFVLFSNSLPALDLIIAAGLWTMAMHAFSAVPDIEPDRSAGVATIATLLGRNKTIVFCLSLYIAAAALAFPYLGPVALTLGIAYAAMMFFALFRRSSSSLFNIYRAFPLVNAAAGFVLFWAAVYLNPFLYR